MTKEDLIAILWQAYGAQVGLLLHSNDPERARMRLYAARKDLGDSRLDVLQIRLTKDFEDGNILITRGERKEKKDGPESTVE